MSTQNRSTEMQDSSKITRRKFMKAGATVGTIALIGGSGNIEFVGKGEAIGIIGTAALVGGAAVVGWTLRETEVVGKDDPPEGLTTGALKLQTYESALKRKSNNQSTFIDNNNIINYIKEPAFSEAKLAAIDAINQGKTQSEVESAAQSAANAHYATIESNFLKSWNEAVNELIAMHDTVAAHGSLALKDVFDHIAATDLSYNDTYVDTDYDNYATVDETVTLQDGTSFTMKEIQIDFTTNQDTGGTSVGTIYWDVINESHSWDYSGENLITPDAISADVRNPDGSKIDYLQHAQWNSVWTSMQNTFTNINSSITTWVENTYGNVQSGELDPSSLLSATELQNTFAQDFPNKQAVADLVAMNVPVDIDNEVTIELQNDNATITGIMGIADNTDLSTVSVGDVIDPSTVSGNIYMAYDVTNSYNNWTSWDSSKGVDGGIVWFTDNPKKQEGVSLVGEVEYVIKTAESETATVTPSDFTETTDGSSNTVWEVDLSSQLSTTITSINKVTVQSTSTDGIYETILINQSFEVLEIDGADSANFEQDRTPQNDTNYITQEEWDELKQQNQKLIEKYEEAKEGNEVLGGSNPLGFLGLPNPFGSIQNLIMYGIGLFAALFGLNSLSN